MSTPARPAPDVWPTPEWRTAGPAQQGMRADLLDAITTFGETSDPPMSGIAVVRSGYLVYEHYFRGFHAGSYHSVNSITKSVLSALVGIALGRHYLPDLDQPLPVFFPEIERLDIDPRVRTITLAHLLGMTTGWAPNHFDLAEVATNPALIATALQRPVAHPPGTAFWYDNLGAHLVATLLARVTGTSTAEFAGTALLGPLGIWTDQTPRFIWRSEGGGPHSFHRFARWDEASGLPWRIDASGQTTGYAGLHFTVRDMARFGYLYLRHGRWEGAQLIPPEYLAASTRPQSEGGPPGRSPYGYFWWTPAADPDAMYYGFGAGGQYVYVLPGLDLVVAIASKGPGDRDPQNPNRTRLVLDRFVRPAATDQ